MTFTKIQPYGPGSYIYWIDGIYKIVSYRPREYFAYFIQDHFDNWGDSVGNETDTFNHGPGFVFVGWKTLKGAKAACKAHAKKHTPAPKTAARAASLKAEFIQQESGCRKFTYEARTRARDAIAKARGES